MMHGLFLILAVTLFSEVTSFAASPSLSFSGSGNAARYGQKKTFEAAEIASIELTTRC